MDKIQVSDISSQRNFDFHSITTKLVGLIHDLYFRPPQIEAGFLGKVHISPGDRFAPTLIIVPPLP